MENQLSATRGLCQQVVNNMHVRRDKLHPIVYNIIYNRPLCSVTKHIVIGVVGRGSIPGPVESDTVLPLTATVFWSCVAQALSCGDGRATGYTLRWNSASIMKI